MSEMVFAEEDYAQGEDDDDGGAGFGDDDD